MKRKTVRRLQGRSVKGSMTVFLSLLLVFILVLNLMLLESARVPGIRLADEAAGNAAANSIQASYIRQLFDEYGLLFYDGGQGSGWIDTDAIEASVTEVFLKNRTESSLFGGSLFRASFASASVLEMTAATDYRGTGFIRNAAAYYPYEAAGDLLQEIREALSLFGKGNAAKADADGQDREREDTDWSTYGIRSHFKEENLRQPGAALLQPERLRSSAALLQDEEDGNEEPVFDEERYEEAIGESPIGDVDQIKAKGWLSLVLPPNSTVSGRHFDPADFPSTAAEDLRLPEDGLPTVLEKVAFNEYLLATFSNYLESRRSDTAQYEIEYILYGKDSDEANLKTALDRIMWMREGANILYLYGSPVRREEAMLLASAMTGWAGIPLLTILTQASLIAAWAYAESILDVRTLLSGRKVPIVKTDEGWTLSLKGIAGFLKGQAVEAKSTETGMDYRGFLRLLLYLKDASDSAYRAMDMIQLYLRRYDQNFCMANALYSMKVRITSGTRPLFSALPLVRNHLWKADAFPYIRSKIYTVRY